MTAPSDGELRNEDLANRAVPHMSQSPFCTPIRGPDSVLIDRPPYSALDDFVRQMASFTTPDDEFNAAKDTDGKVNVDGIPYDDVEEMLSDISDDRLNDEYATFMEMVRKAREIVGSAAGCT